MAFNYDQYLRVEKMPTLWCWGCGDGVILKACIRAIEKNYMDKHKPPRYAPRLIELRGCALRSAII